MDCNESKRIGGKMLWKGKQPRCKTCGDVHFKHSRGLMMGMKQGMNVM